ncbi:hypothetical protein DERF_006512 [Dermatophagoides farinae]|uniref:Uncharacterized protein n=1 Tax=Dermatophagoides farinae TaxID=6954 RepID=A0A922I7X1_DERFA|nr:hypothetical protein DERF_006512 [Dermatophagoides farinae]
MIHFLYSFDARLWEGQICQVRVEISGNVSKISATVSDIDRRYLGLDFRPDFDGTSGIGPSFSHLSESSAYSPQKKFNAFELVDSINSSTVSISLSEHFASLRPPSWKHFRSV